MLNSIPEYYNLLDYLTELDEQTRYRETRALAQEDLFFLLWHLCGRDHLEHPWLLERCREVQEAPDGFLDLWSREHCKMQALDEPTATSDGWKLHGDLKVGDCLFGIDGKICNVIALSEIFNDKDCYEIIFDDGTRIKCGFNHSWTVEKKSKRRISGTDKRKYRERVTLTTEDIFHHDHSCDNRLAIPVSAPLNISDQFLPVDPYILGVWLGDGSASGSKITSGIPDADEMQELLSACNIEVNRVKHSNSVSLRLGSGVRGNRSSSEFMKTMRKMGIIGNKHIPAIYLRASIEQRMRLLQGLMDTDGTCNTRGTAHFCNVNKILVDQVMELCNTLGLKPSFYVANAKYNGLPHISYRVSFQAYKNFPVFKMKRKLARCKDGTRKNPRRYIIACNKIASEPMRCIQVDREDGLYLTSRSMVPTHNSSIITFGKTIQDILNDPEITIGIFSHTRPIAKSFLRQIMRELENNRRLKELFPDILYANPRKESPKWSEDEGIMVKRRGNPVECTIEAWGMVDGMPTGRHFRLRVYDDVVTLASVTSKEQIDKTTEAWEMSDNLGVMGGASRMIGTRYAVWDTYSTVLERRAAKPRIYAATEDGRMDGKPVLFTQEEYDRRLRTQSRQTVAAQLLQNPLADEEATFNIAWLKSFEVMPAVMNVAIMCDPSKGMSENSDNTAMMVVGVDMQGNKYLLDGYCHRMKLNERWERLRDLYIKWERMVAPHGRVDVGYERYGMQTDDEYFTERMKYEKILFPIEELSWTKEGTKGEQGKRQRVERLEPDFRNGRFYLPLNVWRDGKAYTWKIVDGKLVWTEFVDFTKMQKSAIDAGYGMRVMKSIRKYNEEKRVYDLTAKFMEEYSTFPFGRWKDGVDAASRFYDMDVLPPVIIRRQDTENKVYWDS